MQQEDYIGEIGRNEPPRLVLLLTFVATAFTAIVFWAAHGSVMRMPHC